jgi:hypothetical protein
MGGRWIAVSVLLLAIAACDREPAPVSPIAPNAAKDVDPAPAIAPPADEVSAGERARWTGACAGVVRKLQAVIATLPSKCEKDAECVCYRGGVERVTDCGGESDSATAERISELTDEFDKLRCDYSVSCAPRLCNSGCADGKCGYRPRDPEIP